jgi:hypothetical protein
MPCLRLRPATLLVSMVSAVVVVQSPNVHGQRSEALTIDGADIPVVASFAVDIPVQPAQLAAASDRGLYLVDMAASRVVAYDPEGQLLWDVDFVGLGARRSVQAVAVDAQERVFVLEARQRRVYRLGRSGAIEQTFSLEDIEPAFQLFRALAPDGRGGFYLLSGRERRRIHHFDGSKGPVDIVDVPPDLEEPTRADYGGIAATSDGRVLLRPAGRLAIEAFDAASRRYLGARPLISPQIMSRPSPEGLPGDSVWASDFLADGTFVCQVVHRTAMPQELPKRAVSIAFRVYLFDAAGALKRTIVPRRLGSFAAAAPGGRLYFTTTVQGVTGDGPGRAYSIVVP